MDLRIILHTSREGQISPVGASAIMGNVSLGMPGREVFIKFERDDSELHKSSRDRFFSKNTVCEYLQ